MQIRVNDVTHDVTAEDDTPLLYVLRNDLGLKGTRFGCGEGTCGSCMVLVDGEPIHSCDIPLSETAGKPITTIEGLSGEDSLHRLQQAFIDEQAAQCGYCTSGILMSACALLEKSPNPSDREIREALDVNLCRCGSHSRVLRAVQRAAGSEDPASGDRTAAIGSPMLEREFAEGGRGNDHLTVLPDGTVRLSSGKVEIGQGIRTALAQIAAEELGVSIGRIRFMPADTSRSPNDGVTAGSLSVSVGGSLVREAAIELRHRLLTLAAEDVGSSIDDLRVADGVISAPSGESTSYWELAGGSPPDEEPAADPAAAAVVGTALPRWDLPAKFTGEPSFVHDLVLPGMLHGRVVRPPGPRARLEDFDPGPVNQLDGVVEVVRSGSFLGVVAEREEQAIRAVRRAQGEASWDEPAPAAATPQPGDLVGREAEIQVAAQGGEVDSSVERTVTATYTRQFLAHASIGPSCAVALDDGPTMTVWTHSQDIFGQRKELATVLEMAEDQVRVIHMDGAGCYGHNGADDVALDAALLARAVPGRPVRLQWSREDEFVWEPYGSAMYVELTAALDDDGRIVRWSHEGWSHPHSVRPGRGEGVSLLAASHLENPPPPRIPRPLPLQAGAGMLRNAVPLYDLPSVEAVGHLVAEGPARTSALRGLGTQVNIFAIESLMDELAAVAGVDPVEFRIAHLADPRAIDVIEAAVDLAGVPVGGQNDEGHGFGLGFGRYKNSACYVAVVAQVEAETEVRVIRTWAAVDAGLVINPDGAKSQIEGGIIQSASWALKEQVKFEGDRTATRSWLDYPIMTFVDVPEVEVRLIDRPDEPSLGVGEGAAGPTTAAIANGIRAVLGVPVRDLPFTPDRVTRAILG